MSDRLHHARRLFRVLAVGFRHGARSRSLQHTLRWVYYLGAATLALLAIAYTAARLLLPQIETRKAEIEDYLSARTAHVVRIETLEAYWDGLLPGVHIRGLNVASAADPRPAVRLAELHVTFAPLPLAWGQIEIRSLVLTRPNLTVERLADGRLRIVGLEPVALEEPAADEKFLKWLLRQRRLAVRDGEIAWVDRHQGVERLQLSGVQFDLRNRGARHKAGLKARFPEPVCRDCSIAFDIDGNPFDDDWSGEIYLRAVGLDVEALPRIARERLPPALRGRFDAELWSEWDGGAVAAVRGDAAVAVLQLPVRDLDRPLRIDRAQGQVDWRRDGAGWDLDIRRLSLGLRGQPWSAGRLRLTRDDEDHRLRVRHVELADVSSFIADLPVTHPWLARWNAMQPGGALDRVDIEVSGPLSAPHDYRVRAELKGVNTAAHQNIPGVRGLSGQLDMRRSEGAFHFNTQDLALDFPQVFRGPLPGGRVQGLVAWQYEVDAWRVHGRDLAVISPDGSARGDVQLTMPDDRALSPVLELHAELTNGNGRHAAKYYPARHLPPKVLAWMDASIVSGIVTHAQVVFEGPVRDFPFERGTGRFEVRGHVRDGVYRYFKGWPPITHADVDVAVNGRDVIVTGSGRLGDLTAEQVVVQTRPTSDPAKRRIVVTGKMQGPIAENVRVLNQVDADATPPPFWKAYLPTLRAAGNGVMLIDIDIPLGMPRAAFTGEFRASDASLALATPPLALQALNGSVRFSNRGVDAATLRGQLLGGPATLDAARAVDGALVVEARGRALGAELGRLYGAVFAQRISGSTEWQLGWRERAGLGDLQLDIALNGLRYTLPPPFDRSDRPTVERLRLRTEQSSAQRQLLDIEAGDLVRGKLVLEHANGWRMARGHIGFGMNRVPLSARAGLQLSARLNRLDIDQWLPLLGTESGAAPPALLRGIRAEIEQLEWFDRNWNRLQLDLAPAGGGWQASVDGDRIVGRARYVPKDARQPASIDLDLSRLRIPEKKHGDTDTAIDPRRLPAIALRAAAFEYKTRNVGAVDFSAAPFDQGWRIARFNVTRPEGRFSSRGTWRTVGERHASAFDFELSSGDFGQTLDALGAPGQIKGGKVDVRSQPAWAGSPTNPKLAALDGRIEVAADNGRFLQLDPGAARLFGLLDLRAITRYLTLDFSSAFGKGLAFDQIHGTVTIERGNAYTHDLFVKGPSIGLTAEGRVGLAAEDFDLVLVVNPKFSNTLTLTSWGLFGPQAAAAILAIQRLFKKQIAAGTRVTYLVKGSWDDPTITKAGKSTAESEPQAE